MRYVCFVLILTGCQRLQPAADVDGGGTTGAGEETTLVPVTTVDGSGPTGSSGDEGTVSTASTGVSTTGCHFICPDETTTIVCIGAEAATTCSPCDPWRQDCPEGDKCAAWANDGGDTWNAKKCVPVADDPAGVGEPCTVEGNNVTGLDDCTLGAFCWGVDPDTLQGVCVATCTGTPLDPECPAGTSCLIDDEAVLTVCVAQCHPLAGCAGDEGCFPLSSGTEWGCLPAPSPQIASDVTCYETGGCAPGTVCADMSLVPGCAEATGCCTPYCDLSAVDPDAECAVGSVCEAWYDPGGAPAGFGTVGACLAA